jgi:hypothetical protein
MKVLTVWCLTIFFVVVSSFYCVSQPYYSQIGTSVLSDATGYGNGFKVVAVQNQFPEVVLYAVYGATQDTCYFAYSHDRGISWTTQSFYATTCGNARYPSLDVCDSLPYVVTQGDSGGQSEIYLKCPLDWGIPQKVSSTSGYSTLPAIVIGDSFNCHIVWQDDSPGNPEIYYCCAHYPNSVTGMINLSNNGADDRYPSISIFNGSEIHVVWERYDSTCYSPYSIVHRTFSGGAWANEDTLAPSMYIPYHHPSLDFCHGEDDISSAWEDSSSGNLDIYFYQGNPVGWPTTGQSRYPVLSTIGTTWSYAYWEDDSDGYDDVYADLFYFMGGSSYKFRDRYGDEDMHYPTVTNCYVVWTQGDAPPYKVMFACEGYPIGVEEDEERGLPSPRISLSPNPFVDRVEVRLHGASVIRILDITGREVRELSILNSQFSVPSYVWDGRDEEGRVVQSGIYFLKVEGFAPIKVVKLR